jgi:hypothetical protein
MDRHAPKPILSLTCGARWRVILLWPSGTSSYTWFFAFILIAWSLALGYFPTSNAGLGAGTYWVLGVVSALLLFGSVVVA